MESLVSAALDQRRRELAHQAGRANGAAVSDGSEDMAPANAASLQPKEREKKEKEGAGGSSTSNNGGDASESVDGAPRKRKKISRACNNCQVAHLTCSTSRPCIRCVKRGLQDSCQDGARKKAKYLLDVEDERECG